MQTNCICDLNLFYNHENSKVVASWHLLWCPLSSICNCANLYNRTREGFMHNEACPSWDNTIVSWK